MPRPPATCANLRAVGASAMVTLTGAVDHITDRGRFPKVQNAVLVFDQLALRHEAAVLAWMRTR